MAGLLILIVKYYEHALNEGRVPYEYCKYSLCIILLIFSITMSVGHNKRYVYLISNLSVLMLGSKDYMYKRLFFLVNMFFLHNCLKPQLFEVKWVH